MSRFVGLLTLVLAVGPASAHDSVRMDALEDRITALEQQVLDLASSMAPTAERVSAQQRVEMQRTKARDRMQRDAEVYSQNELREIEELYQVANKHWNTPEGKRSLKKLVEKYDRANRTGCALLYLGQMTDGVEREDYLTRAVEGFSDSFYGDGVQVGAYARFFLAHHYRNEGNDGEAARLFREIQTKYPDAIDHRGRPLAELLNSDSPRLLQ